MRRGLALVRRRSPRGPAMRVTLYEKAGCGLCAETYRALTRVRMDVPVEVERIDIEEHREHFDRYALRIPVVRAGEREIDAAGLDEDALRRWLAAARLG